MKPHLRYLRYVLLHKWYVFLGGLQIHGWRPSWVWRLLVHDLSKFRPSEWLPYVRNFYGDPPKDSAETQARRRAFDAAWLAHQHRNAHHWQHWVLREDDGATKILVPPVGAVDEMVADWLGAGTKILKYPTVDTIVAETVLWYLHNRERIQLRDVTRRRVEDILASLCRNFDMDELVIALSKAAGQTIRIVAPLHGGLARVESER